MISASKEHPFILEIEGFDHTVEVLHSRFDNAIDLLPDKAVIFGGAIRDILAKMELKADLDILCHYSLYGKVLRRQFLNDPCWCLINESNGLMSANEAYGLTPADEVVPDTVHELPTVAVSLESTKVSHSVDNLSRYLEQIISFSNVDGVTAQVMVVKQNMHDDSMGLPLALARQVDLICCGVVMTKEGRIYEVVPDAYKDCINRVLRLNPNSQIVSAKRTTNRIEKLVSRGWISAITDKELVEAEKRAELAATSKLKPPSPRLDHLVETAIHTRPFRPPEKRRKLVPHTVGDELVNGEYRPASAILNSNKIVHTALDALERRVTSGMYDMKGLT